MSYFLRLREERERFSLSQGAMAAVAETSLRTYAGWESGRSTPSTEAFDAWSKIGVDVLYIITGQRIGDSKAAPVLSADEEVLLKSYRSAPEAVRNAALAVLLSGGQAPEGVDTSKSRKGRAAPKRNRTFVTVLGGVGQQNKENNGDFYMYGDNKNGAKQRDED